MSVIFFYLTEGLLLYNIALNGLKFVMNCHKAILLYVYMIVKIPDISIVLYLYQYYDIPHKFLTSLCALWINFITLLGYLL